MQILSLKFYFVNALVFELYKHRPHSWNDMGKESDKNNKKKQKQKIRHIVSRKENRVNIHNTL